MLSWTSNTLIDELLGKTEQITKNKSGEMYLI